jgi:hypothetical protein
LNTRLKKLLSLVLSAVVVMNSSIVYAEETSTEIPNGVDSYTCTVTSSVPDPTNYIVTVPKELEIDPETSSVEYEVKVEGTLADENYNVKIQPDNSFELTSGNKEPATATVTQNKIYWSKNQVADGLSTTGSITTETELTVGEWTGTFNFNVSLENTGIYDGNWVMLASWDELEAMGFDVEADYTSGQGFTTVMRYSYVLEKGRKFSISNDIQAIGDYAFSNYGNLTDIVFNDSEITMGSNAFGMCSNLTSVVFNDSEITMGSNAFSMCSNLTDIVFNDSEVTMSNNIFNACGKLTSVVFNDSEVTMSNNIFSACSKLTDIVFNNGLTTIGDDTFNSCVSLTSVVFSDGLTAIGSNAFSNCGNLKTIYYEGSKEQWDAIPKGSNWNWRCPSDMEIIFNYTGQ